MQWTEVTWRSAVIGRWVARIGGTLMALFLTAFIVGEGPPPVWRLSLQQNLHLLALCALFLGLLLGWKWEFWGGAVPIAGFILMGFLEHGNSRNVLSLLCWMRLRAGAPAQGEAWRVPGKALAIAAAAVGAFVLLSVNEMFGNPPLMTPAFHATPALAGEWRSQLTPALSSPAADRLEAALVIGADGSLSGTIGAAQVTGRIANNRSWFGRLMNWREDFAIRGTLSQPVSPSRDVTADRFTGLLAARDRSLNGVLSLANRPLRVRLIRQ
jgi:hypothetical protein